MKIAARRWIRLPLIVVGLVVAAGCGLDSGGANGWTTEEREAVSEFISGLEELRDGLSILNAATLEELSENQRQRALEHLRGARERTATVGDSVLAKIHPELPTRVDYHLRRGIDDRIRSLNGAHPYRLLSGIRRLNQWAEWYDQTRESWNLPGR